MPNNQQGFTLLELIMTLAFLSLVISPLYTFFIQLGDYSYNNRLEQRAYNLAASLLEETTSRPFHRINISKQTIIIENRYQAMLTIQYMEQENMKPALALSPFKLVTARVAWRSLDATENVTLTKIVAE